MEVEKTLQPGAPGTLKYAERFGERLVCVRHRRDNVRGRRITTAEVVVNERPFPPTSLHWPANPPRKLLVRIAFDESALSRAVKEAGGRWLPDLKLWELPREQVLKLDLEGRIVSSPSARSGLTADASPNSRRCRPDLGKTQI